MNYLRGPSTCHDLCPSNSFPREVAGADIRRSANGT